jgi:rhodanese-related sulfurtransferase
VLVDVRGQNDFEADPHLIPSSTRYASNKLEDHAEGNGGKSAIVICQQGSSLSQGATALLRDQGVPAEVLEGGFEAWRQARLPLVPFRQHQSSRPTAESTGSVFSMVGLARNK